MSLAWLLEHGADPDIKSARRDIGSCLQPATPLDYAAKRSDATAVNLLLSHGAKLDPDAIYYAIGIRSQRNGTATLQALIDHGADVNYVSKKYSTPLFHVVRRGQLDKLKLLLEHGADPDIKSLKGRTSALDLAKEKERTDMYEMMEAARSQNVP
jgi:ankyrin repeat protein